MEDNGGEKPVEVIPLTNILQTRMKTAWATDSPEAQFTVGQVVNCQYSADGNYYRGRIEMIQGNQYLVSYMDFGNQSEWRPASALKMI